jgi:hypothetical protein
MKKFELEIVQDNYPNNPRHDDNVTTMVCFHKRYELGDKTDYRSDDYHSWDEMKEQIEKDNNVLMIKPLYMYDHSGITISTSSFSCQWDSGQIGWIFIDKKQLTDMCGAGTYTDKELDEWIEGEVDTYDKYLTGDVWGYNVYEVVTCDKGHEHKKLVESCYGYYGHDECEEMGKSILEHTQKEVV